MRSPFHETSDGRSAPFGPFALLAASALVGCGSSDAAERCPEGTNVVEVAGPDELASALDEASSGSCLALDAGSYPAVALPAGVTLVGESRASVSVAGITVRGSGATFIGHLSVVGSSGSGILAIDTGALTVQDVEVRGSAGPGLWAQCRGGCDCASKPAVSIDDVAVRSSRSVGVALLGVHGVLQGVDVSATGAATAGFGPGGGLAVWGCSDVTATNVHTSDNAFYGALVHEASARLDGLVVTNSNLGLWITDSKGQGAGTTVTNGTFTGNAGVSIGVGGDTVGVIIDGCRVENTALAPLTTGLGKTEQVGDAISWQDGAQVSLRATTLSGSARASLVIDGPVGEGSAIADVTLAGGDETKPFLQQALPAGGTQPALEGSAPQLETSTTEKLAVPEAPKAPAAL